MGETLRQPAAPGLKIVEDSASGETGQDPIVLLANALRAERKQARAQALREVLELIERNRYDLRGYRYDSCFVCDYEKLKGIIEAMIDA